MNVFIFGAGNVGRALAAALAEAGVEVTLASARRGLPTHRIDASVLVLALRDPEITPTATALANARVVPRRSVVVHCAGSLSAEALSPLRPFCAGVAQMHPLLSFASRERPPSFEGAHAQVQGDLVALRRVRRLAKRLGMTPRTFEHLDPVAYHAAAALVANGAATLAALGAELLVTSGVPEDEAPRMLAPLLRSVAENVDALGLPHALTGPIRRGDAQAVVRQLETLKTRFPTALPLFLASASAQLPLARKIGNATDAQLDKVLECLEKSSQPRKSTAVRRKGDRPLP
jgi:predicted short-subunit dehydrogenase-like oxidoreductase (DUF2520 family)